jgi:hypothetical protein
LPIHREGIVSINESLVDGESIVFESHKHWMAPIRASLVAVLMIAGAWLLWLIAPGGGEGLFGTIGGALGSLMDLVAIGLVIGGIGWIVYNVIAWRSAQYAVTNMRVVREEGIASRRTSTTLLSSLSDVRTRIGFLGARLGYGDIELLTQSGGAGVDRFLAITSPAEFRNAVMTQKMQPAGDQARAAVPEAAAPEGTVAATGAPAATIASLEPTAAISAMTSAEAADALGRLADLHERGALTDAEFEAKKTELEATIKAAQPSEGEEETDESEERLSDDALKTLKKELTAAKKRLSTLQSDFVKQLDVATGNLKLHVIPLVAKGAAAKTLGNAGKVQLKLRAFSTPRASDASVVAKKEWPVNPIDNFILAQLTAKGLAPS